MIGVGISNPRGADESPNALFAERSRQLYQPPRSFANVAVATSSENDDDDDEEALSESFPVITRRSSAKSCAGHHQMGIKAWGGAFALEGPFSFPLAAFFSLPAPPPPPPLLLLLEPTNETPSSIAWSDEEEEEEEDASTCSPTVQLPTTSSSSAGESNA